MAQRRSPGKPNPPAAGPPRLMVPAAQLHDEIDVRVALGRDLIERSNGTGGEGDLGERRRQYATWTEYNEALLRRSFDTAEPAEEYSRTPGFFVLGSVPDPLHVRWDELRSDIANHVRRLESLQERLPLYRLHPEATVAASVPDFSPTADVFVVHGHDDRVKVTVASFLSRLLGRDPIILHEQADRGRTIIEKFEAHADDVGAAVVLLTADDEGAAVGKPANKRARQNVILELGFFIGKLGRDRVVVLYESGVELPSDISGMLYVSLDSGGVWRNSVARELEAAGLTVDLKALLR